MFEMIEPLSVTEFASMEAATLAERDESFRLTKSTSMGAVIISKVAKMTEPSGCKKSTEVMMSVGEDRKSNRKAECESPEA
jgi:hypothetical protein